MSRTATRMIGEAEVTILTDGATTFTADMFPGTTPEHIDALLAQAGRQAIETNFNAVLIRSGGRQILADAGPRDLFGDACGFLPEALKEAGADPQDIDLLFATHLHPDHIAGMITPAGDAVFPKAELAVTRGDHAFWSDAARTDQAGGNIAQWGQLARAVLSAYGDRLRLLDDGGEIAPGLHVLGLPGHTPGHAGWRLASGSAQLVHVGDIVHVPALQVTDPAVSIAFDMDADTARATRMRLLDELASDGALFTGGHFLHPAFCKVTRQGQGQGQGSGYRLEQP